MMISGLASNDSVQASLRLSIQVFISIFRYHGGETNYSKDTRCLYRFVGDTSSIAGVKARAPFFDPIRLSRRVRKCAPHAERWLAQVPPNAISAARA